MHQQQTNGRARPSRDPGYVPTRPASFFPIPAGQPLTACSRCAAAIPAMDRAQRKHLDFHGTVDGIDQRADR